MDECNLGSHDCGPLYQCRNTQGSYRCDPKKCAEGELMNPRTGECTNMDCPIGYKPIRGRCEGSFLNLYADILFVYFTKKKIETI